MKQLYRYLPLGDEILTRSLYVIAGGNAYLPPGASYPPSSHPQHHQFHWSEGRVLQEYQLIYIARGSGQLESTSGGLRQVRAGDLIALFPHEWHRYRPDPEIGWEEHWVAFQGKGAAEFMAEHSASPKVPLFCTGINDSLLREFVRIAEEVAEEAVGYQNVVVASLHLILALAMVSHQRLSFQATDVLGIIKRTKDLLMERIDRPTDMNDLAADLRVGYPWLRKMFRQHTGLPLAQYQTQLRLYQACEFLRNTTLPIAAIGGRCGFESAYYFARVFRGKIGCTPSEYRLQSRKSLPAIEEAA